MEAQTIPVGATVTKKNGEKPYTIRDCVKIYGEEANQKELRADDGTRFLISANGDINIVAGDTELVWNVPNDVLYKFLYEIVEGRQFPED